MYSTFNLVLTVFEEDHWLLKVKWLSLIWHYKKNHSGGTKNSKLFINPLLPTYKMVPVKTLIPNDWRINNATNLLWPWRAWRSSGEVIDLSIIIWPLYMMRWDRWTIFILWNIFKVLLIDHSMITLSVIKHWEDLLVCDSFSSIYVITWCSYIRIMYGDTTCLHKFSI